MHLHATSSDSLGPVPQIQQFLTCLPSPTDTPAQAIGPFPDADVCHGTAAMNGEKGRESVDNQIEMHWTIWVSKLTNLVVVY